MQPARDLLAAWKTGCGLAQALDRAQAACAHAAADAGDAERRELLAAIAGEMRAARGDDPGAPVWERLLAHLAGPPYPAARV